MDLKCRNYCFTIFLKDDEKYEIDELPEEITYLIYQIEETPTTGKLHVQGYVELVKPMRINAVKKIFGNNSMHLEKRMGSQGQAVQYCKKDDTRVAGPWEYGEKGKQGKRNDLDDLDKLRDMSITDFCVEHPRLAVKYPNGIKMLKQQYDIKDYSNCMRDIKVTVIIGPAGCGKTRYVYDNNEITSVYTLNHNGNGTLWFDGYNGQDVLLIDDFKGWIKHTQLLKILDRYPYRCEIKGSFIYARWTRVYITSNFKIDSWYDSDKVCDNALTRRITRYYEMDQIGTMCLAPLV
jgi:hypothetical protein